MNEHAALRFMLEHFEPSDPAHVILTVDRGYGSYNLIVQLQRKDMRFVMRAKDYTSCKSMLSSFTDEYPDTPEFDVEINVNDLLPENFNSAEALYELIQKLQDE